MAMWELSACPSLMDVLDRRRLANTIADQLDQSSGTAPAGTDGPLVVTTGGLRRPVSCCTRWPRRDTRLHDTIA